jgi:hypothetical protein
MTRRTILLVFALEAIVFAFLVFALLDRRAHKADVFGVNQWGYRGEARGERQPGEIRVALVGGSAAYESATNLEDTMAMAIVSQLQEIGRPRNQEYSLVNLAQPRVSADSYLGTLRRYAFLDPDAVAVVDGYDTIEGLPPHARERSAVFRAAGYLPILPARILGRPAWLSDPDGGTVEMLRDGRTEPADVGCDGASKAYCAAMADTVRFVLQEGLPIVVASPPFVTTRHAAQQRSLGALLTETFGSDPRFLYLDLGTAINLTHPAESPDGIHRTVVGNHEVGQPIAVGILRVLNRMRTTPVNAPPRGSR